MPNGDLVCKRQSILKQVAGAVSRTHTLESGDHDLLASDVTSKDPFPEALV